MNGCEHPVYVSPCAEKKRAFGVSMRFEFLPVGVDGDSLSTTREATNFAFYTATNHSRLQIKNSFVSGASRTPVPTRFEGNRTKERSRVIHDFRFS